MKILVIEDDKVLRELLCRLLNGKGYETLRAKDEQEAEDILTSDGRAVSIAIVDMQLSPKSRGLDMRESGLRIIKTLTAQYPDIESIVYTGYETFENAMKCMEEGASYYLVKGSETDLLLQIVERAARAAEGVRKLQRARSAGTRIIKELQGMVDNLDKIHPILENMRGWCERFRDEMKSIEGEKDA